MADEQRVNVSVAAIQAISAVIAHHTKPMEGRLADSNGKVLQARLAAVQRFDC